MTSDEKLESVKNTFLTLQNSICNALEEHETNKFQEEVWNHIDGGGGRSRILEGGSVLERAGVNFSYIEGKALPLAATQKRPELIGKHFIATGVSVVIHPLNPYVPTTHFNVRFILAFDNKDSNVMPIEWFGGGFDLTPYYPFEEDCIHWHQMAKNACDPFGKAVYPKFKQWCDDYFFLKHRNETRGIGGIFFDDLNHWPFESCFEFVQSVGRHFLLGYLPILEKRKNTLFTERERDFQCYRRGRYVEFNLIYDRGTLFGLQSGGRTESILMSLPPEVKYKYNWAPTLNTPEAELYEFYLKPREWIRPENLKCQSSTPQVNLSESQ